MNGHQALRKGRVSIENQVYLITSTTFQRTPVFGAWETATEISKIFHSPSVLKTSEILAWVVMPDHVHFLISIGKHDTLERAVGRLKASSTRRLHSRHFVEGQIWTGAFHDRAIRQENDILEAARYIVANPLRAGLVKRIGDYPFWNAVWL